MVGTAKRDYRPVAPTGMAIRLRDGVIACPVCSHMARCERTDRGLRVICAQCSASYAVGAR